ncbi:MAG: PAS domain S-box protein [Richelia sp. RM2_1_2]|nr:PAS domain S-box protein [Richelia sp. SM1_7_0]NJN09527.1 PAS domain S-box protein [Richelia sp. RM1_1_1]NJO27246.1 PAS domain S-box protein [Richelia sp. SL_2_1]NJO59583.1 PAS domain S-box protein [Richelia sp. RM2_1_2]
MNQSRYPASNNNDTTQTDARFERIVQSMAQIVWCANRDGQATYFNQQWYQLTGLDESQSLGLNFLQAVDAQQRNRVSQSWFSAINRQQIWKDELRIIHQDNQAYWYAASAQACFDESGEIIEWVVVCHNIDKYKTIETELKQQEVSQEVNLEIQKYFERLTLALDAAKMGSWHWDSFTNKNVWTPYHDVIFGYEPGNGEHTYEDWATRLHPDDLALAEAAWKTALREHKDYVCEYRIVLPDDSVRWVESYGRYYYDDDGKALRMAGTVIDISERKQWQEALQESEKRFRSTFEQAAVGIAHADLSGKFIRVNQKLCDILGYSRQELLQLRFQQIIHPDDLQSDLTKVRDFLAGKTENFSMEKRYLCKDGSVNWVEITVSFVREANGSPKYFLSVVQDISGRKQAETQLQLRAQELEELNILLTETTTKLRKRNSELDQFAYIASHDLKAPLRAIANLSQWLEDDLSTVLEAENRRYLELLRQRVYRMEALINGLLQYSRVGRIDGAKQVVNVGQLLEEIIEDIAPPSNFTIEIKHPMPILNTKGMMLKRVLTNLVDNAITHHHAAEGHIQISVADKGEFYEFAVSDDGPGISAEYHDKIFVIFQTLQARDQKEGTGVGLSIVKKILESQGATITVESDVGKGSTFRFNWHK